MYAVIENPDRDGRNYWESFDTCKHAKYIAAFYRYTYGSLAEVWTIKRDGTLGKCIKREIVDATHPYRNA